MNATSTQRDYTNEVEQALLRGSGNGIGLEGRTLPPLPQLPSTPFVRLTSTNRMQRALDILDLALDIVES